MFRLILTVLMMVTVNICNAALIISAPKNYGTFTISSQINFGAVALGSDLQPEITITNTGLSPLQLGGIASPNTVSAPFRVLDTGCANSVIQPGGQCSVMVLFEPTLAGSYLDKFNIEITSEGISHEVTLVGEGAVLPLEPDIQVSFSSVNFGIVDVLENTASPYIFPPKGSVIPVMIIKNVGDSALDISSVSVTGQDSSEVTIQGDCAAIIAPGVSCGILIEFKPVSPGVKNAVISIISNDPDESPFNILIRGTATEEDDGVPASVEDAGPNKGDGNNDDILDSKQSNVVTLLDSFGTYVTYLTDDTFHFSNMSTQQQIETPADFVIGSGIFDFIVEGFGVGQSIEVGVILPAGMRPGAYYMYAPTADNQDKHWFNFNFDGETGAFILGDVTFTTSSGVKFSRSVLRIILKDGGRGDSDLTENGVIAVTSAMPISSNEGSASISFIQLLCLTSILFLARYSERVRLSFGNFY